MADRVTDLARLDPEREWKPWEASAADPWSTKWAGHLLRRAAFGGTWAEIGEAVKAGPETAVERLLAGGSGSAEFDRKRDADAPYTEFQPSGPTPDAPVAEPTGLDLEGWWLQRMVQSPHPLRERMTLFWHNHFATTNVKVRSPAMMHLQNMRFRQHALGTFDALVQEISKDPAMLVWLDSNSNVRGAPNENYARELMELFTLGVGHYTEKDVREAARAFTGWHTPAPGPTAEPPLFTFKPDLHDDDPKTVLGQAGNWDGKDVVRIVLEQPACARFIVRKLYRHFVSETAAPPDTLLEPLAERLRSSGFDLAATLKVLFRSRHFYSRFAHRQRVKGPVEYLVGLVRTLEVKFPADGAGPAMSAVMRGLGQTLFAPPNVKGWDGGLAWLNTSTLIARHNAAWRLVQPPGGQSLHIDPAGLLQKHAPGRDAAGQVEFLLQLLTQPAVGEVDKRAASALAAFLTEGKPSGLAGDLRIRELVHTIAGMPLCQMA